jgi:hypothetical protein
MDKFDDIENKIKYQVLTFDNANITFEELDFIFNKQEVIDKVLYLQLTHCNITALPESILNLKKLQELYLNDNNITSLPESLANLRLTKLVLLGNRNLLDNKHNIDILFNIYNRKISERAKPTILVDNNFGGLDLITGRHVKNNPKKKFNQNRLLDDDFEKLFQNLNAPTSSSRASSRHSSPVSSRASSRRSYTRSVRSSSRKFGGARKTRRTKKSKKSKKSRKTKNFK